jgi:hypothetical protein
VNAVLSLGIVAKNFAFVLPAASIDGLDATAGTQVSPLSSIMSWKINHPYFVNIHHAQRWTMQNCLMPVRSSQSRM